MLRRQGKPVEFFRVAWATTTAAHLGIAPGLSKFQSFWEMFTMLHALVLWGDEFTDTSVPVLGDCTSALSDALNLAGKRTMIAVAKEVAWRQIRQGWRFRVGPLPAEHNLFVDALSRFTAPDPVAHPAAQLHGASERRAADSLSLWRAALHF